jgi:hypothetical protein
MVVELRIKRLIASFTYAQAFVILMAEFGVVVYGVDEYELGHYL